jgi:hypothetical protein
MPSKRAFIASLFGATVLLSVLTHRATPQRITTGTIIESQAGEWIAVASEQTDPRGFRITLREATTFEGNPAALRTGAHVTVWWRSVGERSFVADRVRVLPFEPTRYE